MDMLWSFRKLARHTLLVALASACPAVAQSPRAATLLPPQPLGPGERAPVARAAMDDPPTFATTPVNRPANPQPRPAGPAWLHDSNVRPASGQVAARPPAPTPARDQPSAITRGIDKIKTFVAGERPEPGMYPGPGREQPTASTPFRSTGANGAPVYAGPPAWRWYGYGTVTPGMNPLAPDGQYPRASANWYAVTAATPGAVPVPVMNPYRPAPGSEPPGYLTAPVTHAPRPPAAQPTYPQTPPPARTVSNPPPADGSKFGPAGGTVERSKFEPPAPPVNPLKPLPPPPMPADIGRTAIPVPPPTAVGVPTLNPPPAVARPTLPSATTAADPLPVKPVEPVVALPPIPVVPTSPVVPSEPVGVGPKALADAALSGASKPADPPPAAPVVPLTPAVPAPAAASTPAVAPAAKSDDVQWQSTPQKHVPLETWAPATGTQPPARPQPAQDRGWQPGASLTPSVARGQAEAGTQPNPAADLIHAMCHGRARDVDIRWTGSQRLTVCFEVRTEPEGNRLVKELCARPELRPFAIDFCVLVK